MRISSYQNPGWIGLLLFVGSVDCSSGFVGNGTSGDPDGRVRCTTTADCAAGEICHFGGCEAGTLGDGPAGGDGAACNCTGRQTCDTATDTCQDADICTNDGDCVAPRVCLNGTCIDRPECRTTADCTGGLICYEPELECAAPVGACSATVPCPSTRFCNTASGFCVGCLVDSDCPGTQVCPLMSCEEGPSCSSAADCLGPRICNAGSCESPPCVSDTLEPNDDPTNAASIAAGSHQITVSPTDEDYLFVPLALGDGLLARASYDDSLGAAINTEMLDADENFVDFADGSLGGALLQVGAAPTAGVYLHFVWDNGVCIPIDLTVEIFAGGHCFNDDEEPNDTPATARVIPADPSADVRFVQACPGDADWFSVTVASGNSLTVTVETTYGIPPLAEMYDQDGSELLLRDLSGNPNKSLVQANTGTGAATYMVLIEAVGSAVLGADATVTFDSQ